MNHRRAPAYRSAFAKTRWPSRFTVAALAASCSVGAVGLYSTSGLLATIIHLLGSDGGWRFGFAATEIAFTPLESA
eukprot:368582-Prorocentrum_minimum.AAC.1